MASEKPKTSESHLERLTTEFIEELGGCNKYAITCSFRELRAHVTQLKTLNIHYNWQRYEICEKLYGKWKKEHRK